MSRPIAILLPATALLALSACASTGPKELAEIKPIGEPENCLLLQNIRQTQVVDGQTIDFITRGGTVYRNRLPNQCPQLGFERAFSYSTSITQLCNVDIITVLIQASPMQRGASCGLGQFVPISKRAEKEPAS
ncbi:MAG: hypothetical protein ACMVO5_07860 [Polymorphobacter sp.]|uniref:hypothetical protein n=1 Tax=Polymorphobacter sp. TaxID=1909290 RepID=UPI003A8B7D40